MLSKLGRVRNMIPKSLKMSDSAKKVGLVGIGMAINAAIVLPEALAGFKYEYNDNGQKINGTNWKCGSKATLKSIAKVLGFGVINGAVAAAFAGCSAVIAAPLAVAGLYFGWVKSSDILEKMFKNEGQVVAEACKAKGIAYDPTKKDESLLGSVTNPEGAMV